MNERRMARLCEVHTRAGETLACEAECDRGRVRHRRWRGAGGKRREDAFSFHCCLSSGPWSSALWSVVAPKTRPDRRTGPAALLIWPNAASLAMIHLPARQENKSGRISIHSVMNKEEQDPPASPREYVNNLVGNKNWSKDIPTRSRAIPKQTHKTDE